MSSRLEWLGSLSLEEAEAQLLTCNASRSWARKMVANRPYADESHLTSAAVTGVTELAWADIEEALSAHPRIGERTAAKHQSEQEAQWSAEEQSGAADADARAKADLAAGNVAYEEQFGHVFLIRAAGRSAAEMLSELRIRLGNSVPDEQLVVRRELADITGLRVRKLLDCQ
ncbi:2-oxo-4-hydroxy-4-carboxy-5-ureidoimidazoline decarboxylase [Nocardia seriolae]|uniref:2-oxo-4-hydroxy-4-carboxy-5-ureidoimidazoline decarboxylase n=1 Tax=Nocardia seriolae TaxID=37332 RepID=A0A0B8N7V0_9NOCA|nr:2-oxo-4-hydroxy-4-carboxy-5-ureidoimidazoline decarboxylase [Nocardia seriolae]APA98327.1 2-oxo-4-hydroxy-4-carboxy-5-ureidoimidazoline decarboxylase [Nocardia seriolae]MTJ63001.1 2-oxo-4-hydroxy-4-carboxy-5-ureidoimidazoline decarboxylase [Nocardia seriolae]MTJ75638.1 2-oxo-4-hydroxy-4-carboxy-5-ureidoimidazoline decarboxylase [Nocardia seriolae]MTJ88027.1 2-oxo-4-hydroxy-4-carboxy-5-ureidoimidazoline decarboxylase [Nocardia seriolae]MTK32016.1 2-oxo-4-hydroxy-4-carboxy-5-ureidoimidazoline